MSIKFRIVDTHWTPTGKSLQWKNGSYNKYWFRDWDEYQENIEALRMAGHNFSYDEDPIGVDMMWYIQLLSIGVHKTIKDKDTGERYHATVRYFLKGDAEGTLFAHNVDSTEELSEWLESTRDTIDIFSVS